MKDRAVELSQEELRSLEQADEYLREHHVEMFNCPVDQIGSNLAYQALLERNEL